MEKGKKRATWPVCHQPGCQIKGHRHLPIETPLRPGIVNVPDKFRALR